MKRATILILSLAITSLLVAIPATAGTTTIELSPMPVPGSSRAWGMAATSTARQGQRFLVRADAGLPNGSAVVISVEIDDPAGPSMWVAVAKGEIQLGTVVVILSNDKDISPVFPVNQINRVRVSYRGRVILQGSFFKF